MNETLADILAGMRDPENDYITNNDLRDLADRIEAAAQREKVEAVTIAATKAVNLTDEKWRRDTGNAAALRAALEKIVRVAEEWDTPGIHAVQATLYRILEAARAALSAPARNCDRFRTADEVSAYWGANVHAVPLHGDAYAMRIDGREFATFLDWLMAPAKEAKSER